MTIPLIREASTARDLDAIVAMGEAFWAQTLYAPHVPYDHTSMRRSCVSMLSHSFSAKMPLLWVAVADDEVVGALGLAAATFYTNDSVRYLAEMFWYVQPEYRRAGLGQGMYGMVEHAARRAGYEFLSMMLLESVEADRAAAIYQKMGFVQAERTFLKRISAT